jgi:perosamine synthetase
VRQFEESFSQFVGISHAAAVSSGTAALHLALNSLGLGPGDEVIVPDFCMASPVLAVMYCGATPVPVDVDSTWNLDPDAAIGACGEKTKAILVVHNYGHPAEMDRLSAIAHSRNIPIVEDAAEALGAAYHDRAAGTLGDISCFSFYANKVITTGEGGLVATSRRELWENVVHHRDLCFGRDNESRFVHDAVGFNYRMSSLQAAVGLGQLKHATEAIADKIRIADRYRKNLGGIAGLLLPPEAQGCKNSYWVFGVVIRPEFPSTRFQVQELLRARGIETRRFFSPIHQQPFMKNRADSEVFRRSVDLSQNGFYLPSYVGMTIADIDRVSENLIRIANSRSKGANA